MSSTIATQIARSARRINLRPTAAKLHSLSSPSALSSNARESVCRFQEAMEDYRTKNYTQTIPPRFRKEITNVIKRSSSSATASATSVEQQKQVAVETIQQFLQNIGAFGNKVTRNDVETIVSELAETSIRDEESIRADLIVTKLLK